MKKLLTILVFVFLGFTSKAQIDTLHVTFNNPDSCYLNVSAWFINSTYTDTTSAFCKGYLTYGNGDPNGTYGTEAWIIMGHDTATVFIWLGIGFTDWCDCKMPKYKNNVYMKNTRELNFKLCDTTSVGYSTPRKAEKKLIKITDFMGNEATPEPFKPYIYIYSDGTVERKLFVN